MTPEIPDALTARAAQWDEIYRAIPAIPTVYRGVRFRSKLEARWGAMFDELGWAYQYEPCRLDGWLPDFALSLPGHEPVLVEVKPLIEFMPDIAAKMERAAPGTKLLLLNGVAFDAPRAFFGRSGNDPVDQPICTGAIDDADLLLGFAFDGTAEMERWRPAVLGWFGPLKNADAMFLYHPDHPLGDGYTGLLSGWNDEERGLPWFDPAHARNLWLSASDTVKREAQP